VAPHCDSARAALVPLLAAASMESYAHTYSFLVRLQVLQELQAAVPLLSRLEPPDGSPLRIDAAAEAALEETLGQWDARAASMSSSIQALEPVIALRVCLGHELLARLDGFGEAPPSQAAAAGRLRGELHRKLGGCWLRLAKSARAAGNTESAGNALAQARLHDSTLATVQCAEMDWAAGRAHDALSRLRQQCAKLETDAQGALAESLLLLARLTGAAGEAEAAEAEPCRSLGALP